MQFKYRAEDSTTDILEIWINNVQAGIIKGIQRVSGLPTA